MTPSSEPAEWKPSRCNQRGVQPSASRLAIEAMEVGEVRRISHEDMSCGYPGKTCALQTLLAVLRRLLGRQYESYHEKPHVAVVKRVQ